MLKENEEISSLRNVLHSRMLQLPNIPATGASETCRHLKL